MNSCGSEPRGKRFPPILIAGFGVVAGFVLRDLLKSKPSYTSFKGKITPHNHTVRLTGVEIARQHDGSYNLNQVFDIFDWVHTNLKYVSDPEPDHIAYPEETIVAGGGDCDDLAVTTASLINSIGGRARVAVAYSSKRGEGHAFAEVFISLSRDMPNWVVEGISQRYVLSGDIHWEVDQDTGGLWLTFDTLLAYPGALPIMAEKCNGGWQWPPDIRVKYYY